MLELLYTTLLYLIQPLIWIRLWVRGRKAPAYRKRWGERYGFYRRSVETRRNHAAFRLSGRNSGGYPIGPRSTVIAIPICLLP
nr:3-deoxy-D-manno-octulosonic-acid transferase [Salmonella sp. NCTC 7297]